MIKRYPIPNLGRTLEVDVDNERVEAELARQQARDRALKIEDLRRACFADVSLWRCTFDNDDQAQPELTDRAKRYVERFVANNGNCKGLLLYGKVGRGKTYAAAEIANALIDNCFSCYMTTFFRISNGYWSASDREEYIRRFMRYQLLIIDDLGVERDSGYMNEIVENVIDERYRSEKPLIITTNLTGSELKSPADINKARIYSRLFEMCDPINVVGDDRRKAKLLQRIDEGVNK